LAGITRLTDSTTMKLNIQRSYTTAELDFELEQCSVTLFLFYKDSSC